MTDNAVPMEDEDEVEQAGESRTRQRSTIGFPYTDYEGAAAVAVAIYTNVGHGTCSAPAHLAPWLGLSAKSSSFRTQLAAARLFGLIESDNSDSYRLSPLGIRVNDPAQARAAKAEAFLKVPLFFALYKKYEGLVVPPSAALESEIAALGVSEKQKVRARQVFESSAEQTGFREKGANRLVPPTTVVPAPMAEVAPAAPPPPVGNSNGGGGGGGLDLDPLLIALLQKIPPQGQEWPRDRRLRWFKTFAMNVSEVYDGEGEPVELSITVAPSGGHQ